MNMLFLVVLGSHMLLFNWQYKLHYLNNHNATAVFNNTISKIRWIIHGAAAVFSLSIASPTGDAAMHFLPKVYIIKFVSNTLPYGQLLLDLTQRKVVPHYKAIG